MNLLMYFFTINFALHLNSSLLFTGNYEKPAAKCERNLLVYCLAQMKREKKICFLKEHTRKN
ncbi:hypothetical protein HanPSC8_Chr17g0750991 [Helianthus annuus]|nr:hypothetical protein HanPSC8_Chr17g0750991 [Helianthus annuus]